MTREAYLKQFCKEVCGECRLPKPEKCYWQEIMSNAWDASHKTTMESIKTYLDKHLLTMIDGDTYTQLQTYMNDEGRD